MVCSLLAMKKEKTNLSLLLQIVTILSGVLFLVNKFIEWSAHIERGIYPDSPVVLAMSGGEIIFYSLYYVMTGIHGLHVLVGVGLISATVIFTFRRTIGPSNFVKLENTGLYWHFVDIIWIYLFPLFYLIT
jgi:cytochrome c oxidase subunit 3